VRLDDFVGHPDVLRFVVHILLNDVSCFSCCNCCSSVVLAAPFETFSVTSAGEWRDKGKSEWFECFCRFSASRLLYCNKYRHFPTCTTEYICSAIHVGYMRLNPAVIHIPAHCNMTGRSMIPHAPMLSPRSILPPPSHYALIPARKKIRRAFKKLYFINFFLFSKKSLGLLLRHLKYCKFGSVCIALFV
jgi:hypothetical protein